MSRYPARVAQRSTRRRPRVHHSFLDVALLQPGAPHEGNIPRRTLPGTSLVPERPRGWKDTATDNFTVKGGSNGWSRPGGGNGQELQVRIGSVQDPLLCDVRGTLAWSNNSATPFTGRVSLGLFTGQFNSGHAWQRSDEYAAHYLPADGNARFFAINSIFVIPGWGEIVDASTGQEPDWWIGFQVQSNTGGNVASQSIARQSIICDLTSVPFYDNSSSESQDPAGRPLTAYPRVTVPDTLS